TRFSRDWSSDVCSSDLGRRRRRRQAFEGGGVARMSYLDGHRQRLRDRFNGSGLGAFEHHEVLELLLTFVVPRKDVKPIAHALLEIGRASCRERGSMSEV